MKIDPYDLAEKCFPTPWRSPYDEDLAVCQLCFATVPRGAPPPDSQPIPPIGDLDLMQSGHVLWHLIVLEGLS